MALDKITTNIIEDDAITAAKIVAGAVTADIPTGGVSGDKIGYFENPTATQNLTGTYSTERMYLNDSYTLTGDVTLSGHLALGTVANTDVVITNDSTARTITGNSGTLEGGRLLSKPKSDLTGMTGVVGQLVTGGGGLTDGSSLTSLGTVASGTLGSGVTFPAGHMRFLSQSGLQSQANVTTDAVIFIAQKTGTFTAGSKILIEFVCSSIYSPQSSLTYGHLFLVGVSAKLGHSETAGAATDSGLGAGTAGLDIIQEIGYGWPAGTPPGFAISRLVTPINGATNCEYSAYFDERADGRSYTFYKMYMTLWEVYQ